MRYYIVIPAHNEESFIGITLQSVMNQTLQPARVIVVNDNSTDGTAKVISGFTKMYPKIMGIEHSSEDAHLPGSKVVKAFQRGLRELDDDYELLVKLDADLVLAEFGLHATGGIHLLVNENRDVNTADRFTLQTLDDRAGTIHVPTIDLNNDGRMDFIADQSGV